METVDPKQNLKERMSKTACSKKKYAKYLQTQKTLILYFEFILIIIITLLGLYSLTSGDTNVSNGAFVMSLVATFIALFNSANLNHEKNIYVLKKHFHDIDNLFVGLDQAKEEDEIYGIEKHYNSLKTTDELIVPDFIYYYSRIGKETGFNSNSKLVKIKYFGILAFPIIFECIIIISTFILLYLT